MGRMFCCERRECPPGKAREKNGEGGGQRPARDGRAPARTGGRRARAPGGTAPVRARGIGAMRKYVKNPDVRPCACGPLADAHVAPRVYPRAPHVDARGKRRPDR
ncbi:hypothetical protein ACT79_29445 [Burkholderia pseudomallei]|nr:hypothetical protein ACT79_29445 [Burkholderia pseudomallei]